jgi:uncharacterized protein (TIGR04255 family)
MSPPLKAPPVYFTVAQVRFNAVLTLADFVPSMQEAMRREGFTDFGQQQTVVLQFSGPDAPPAPLRQDRFTFGTLERKHLFLLDRGALTLQSTDYGTFQRFSEMFLRGLAIVDKAVALDFTERAGLRYLDRVVPREGESLGDYLVPGVLGAKGLLGEMGAQTLHTYAETVSKVGDVQLRARVVTQAGPLAFPPDLAAEGMAIDPRLAQGTGWHAIIDSDGTVDGRAVFSIEDVAARLDKVHQVIGRAFHETATEFAFKAWNE